MYPYTNPSILAQSINLFKSVNWSALLDGTGKTLGVINQAIPVFYQVKPLFSNAKTIFKIANEINNPTDNIEPISEQNNNTSPIFYI